MSCIIGLGQYEGGELWIWDEGGDAEVKVERNVVGYSFLEGDALRGKTYDIHEKWLLFDGKLPRAAMPYTGERINLVYFASRCSNRMQEECRKALHNAGSPLPQPVGPNPEKGERCGKQLHQEDTRIRKRSQSPTKVEFAETAEWVNFDVNSVPEAEATQTTRIVTALASLRSKDSV